MHNLALALAAEAEDGAGEAFEAEAEGPEGRAEGGARGGAERGAGGAATAGVPPRERTSGLGGVPAAGSAGASAESERWCREAAARGHPGAMYRLAQAAGDHAEAVWWLRAR